MNKQRSLISARMDTRHTCGLILILFAGSVLLTLMDESIHALNSYEMGYAVGTHFKRVLCDSMIMAAIYSVISRRIKPIK